MEKSKKPPGAVGLLCAMAEAEAEGLTLGAFLARLADYWQGVPKPDAAHPHPKPIAMLCDTLNPLRLHNAQRWA